MGTFRVLMWKFYTVRKRRWIQTIVEFFVPISLMIGMFSLRNMILSKAGGLHTTPMYMSENFALSAKDLPKLVLYSPDTPLVHEFMQRIICATKGSGTKYMPVVNATLLRSVKQLFDQDEGLAVVDFENFNGTEMPDRLTYTVSMTALIPTKPKNKYQRINEKFNNEPLSFLNLQWVIDSNFLALKAKSLVRNVTFRAAATAMPNRVRVNKLFLNTVFSLLPYLTFMAPLIPFVFLMNRLLEERSTGIQELVKMEGVTSKMLAVTQFINSLPSCLIYCLVGTILQKSSQTKMVPATNGIILFFGQFFHFISMLALAYPCSYIMRNAQYTVSLSMFVYIGLWIPIRLLGEKSRHDIVLFIIGLLPHCPSYWFLHEMMISEIRDETGITFRNWHTQFNPNKEKDGSVLASLVMELVQITYYSVLAWYLEKVRPGQYGIPMPWNFFFKKSYWVRDVHRTGSFTDISAPLDSKYNKYFEEGSSSMKVGIRISNVTKIFGKGERKFKALDNVSLDIYKGEITVLLGHNGAGKTTLISIVTGMLKPTIGKVYVDGWDTSTQKAQVHQVLGLCPQHNLFFADLTVEEHLRFFSKLRGRPHKEACLAAQTLMKHMNLKDAANKRTNQLSGGMLRRLQLGCALCGDSTVLILDEPTSGLDVESRRELWDILLSLKGDRTVVLTTHFMEEADVLGDRLAALHKGRLHCHATPMFLKHVVGSGCRLHITTVGEPEEPIITSTITEVVPTATLTEKCIKTLSYLVPVEGDMQKLFETIEAKKEELNISQMNIGITTLEEVFIELCCDINKTNTRKSIPYIPQRLNFCYLPKCKCLISRLRALFTRQIDFTTSKFFPFLILQVILPIILCNTLTKLFNNQRTKKHQVYLNLDLFPNLREVTYSIPSPNFRNENPMHKINKTYPQITFLRSSDSLQDMSKQSADDRIAVHLNDSEGVVLYSPYLEHSAAVGLNLLSNMLAIKHMPKATGKDIMVKLKNNMPLMSAIHIPKTKINCALFSVFNICTIMSTVINDVILPCRERITVARHTHIMAGCPPYLYWLTTFIYHMVYFTFVCGTAVVSAAVLFDYDKTINDKYSLLAIFVVTVICGINVYAYMYVVSFYMNERNASMFLISQLNLFGFLSQILIMALEDLKTTNEPHLYTRIMNVVGLIIPPHLYAQALNEVTDISRFNSYCKHNFDKCPDLPYFTEGFDAERCCRDGSATKGPYIHLSFDEYAPGDTLFLLLVQFLFLVSFVLLLEYGVCYRLWRTVLRVRRPRFPAMAFNCEHVAAEKVYIGEQMRKHHHEITDAVLVHNTWKAFYSSIKCTPKYALRDANFSVQKGECFGLLGVNGAGKTTTFEIISGQEPITKGKIFCNGHFIGRNVYLKSLGYCPQFCGLDDFRSGASNLRMLLTLRGLHAYVVDRETRTWLEIVGMEKHMHRRASGYSGGMKRRMATAAALCGGAPVTLLDEPTAGVDTAARRLVWAAIQRGLMDQRAIVFASQSMDEVEKLCTRVTILSEGEMCALGTPNELKDEIAPGYAVAFKMRAANVLTDEGKQHVEEFKKRMAHDFRCKIKEEHRTSLHYRINQKLLYSEMFAKVTAVVRDFEDVIEDYCITDTTLEEVFLQVNEQAHAKRSIKPRKSEQKSVRISSV